MAVFFYGHNQTVSPRGLVPPLDPGLSVTTESMSESLRVFRIYIFFSQDESEELIEHTMKVEGLKRSTNGLGVSTDKGQTSENMWDSRSPVARKMITRSFNLTGIVEDAGQIDGLQVVRYLQKQFYNLHHDYFEPESDKDFDFNPYLGGSNRFDTVFMYINGSTPPHKKWHLENRYDLYSFRGKFRAQIIGLGMVLHARKYIGMWNEPRTIDVLI